MTENGGEHQRILNATEILETTREHFEEYSGNSTIHGIRYLGERKRPLVEKIWWVIAFIISIGFCYLFISTLYEKWIKEPVIVSFDSESMSLYDIPFPAVTICPSAKIASETFNYTETLSKMIEAYNKNQTFSDVFSDKEIFDFETMAPVCFPYTEMDLLNEYSTHDHVANIFNLSKNLESTIKYLEFNDEVEPEIRNLFTEILTEEGICFNFNLLQARDIFKEHTVQYDYDFLENRENKALHWNYDDGYSNEADEDAYPRRSLRKGLLGGLLVELIGDSNDDDNICLTNEPTGYKILIHSPNEFPDFEKHSITLQKRSGLITIIPDVIIMSETLRSYNPERRKCYFTDERFLYYYKKYSQSNCEQECLSNFTLLNCGCVTFALPRENTTMLCGPAKLDCAIDSFKDFHRLIFKGKNNLTKLCNCLPNCNYIEYRGQFIESDVNWSKRLKVYEQVWDIEEHASYLFVAFDRKEIITLFRSERYGLSDFISNCGGLLGLFMGISILSFVEIIYYCTIRLICNYRKKDEAEE